MSLAEVENMAALQPFTLGGSGALLPQGNFGDFRHSKVHSLRTVKAALNLLCVIRKYARILQ